jgi:hypothetical protein
MVICLKLWNRIISGVEIRFNRSTQGRKPTLKLICTAVNRTIRGTRVQLSRCKMNKPKIQLSLQNLKITRPTTTVKLFHLWTCRILADSSNSNSKGNICRRLMGRQTRVIVLQPPYTTPKSKRKESACKISSSLHLSQTWLSSSTHVCCEMCN